MKSILITAFALIAIILLVIFYGFSSISERGRSEESWYPDIPNEQRLVNGSWGTEIIVEYEDGSTETLNKPPLLGVTFRDKKVSNFRYILSSKGTSNTYNVIELDISNFDIQVIIKDQEGEWGIKETLGTPISIDMDGDWSEVYRVTVSASELKILEVNKTYNLSFTPSGFVGYRGSTSGSWQFVPLPNWYYLNFKVKSDYDPEEVGEGEEPEEPIEKWINVELTSDFD